MYISPDRQTAILTPPRTASRTVRDYLCSHGWQQAHGHHRVHLARPRTELIRFEQLEQDLGDALGHEVTLPNRHASPRREGRHYSRRTTTTRRGRWCRRSSRR